MAMRTLSAPTFAASLLMAACWLGLATVSAQELAISAAQSARPSLPLQQIVANLEACNAQRTSALAEFEGDRIYRMEYRGFPGNRDAEMVVRVNFHAPNDKEFKVVSESGSHFIIDHVFKKLIEGEEEYSRTDNRQNSLTRANYDFELAGYEDSPEGGAYILALLPKTKNKFLYRGKIWVDAKDFAVTRIVGEPARNPSMWIKKTSIAHRYTKVDGFWLPAENHTESLIRLGGTATLSIQYQNYKITKAPVRAARKNSQVGDPSLLDGRLASVATVP